MRLVDQLRSVRHTFGANRGRTALTLIGIMIGTGSIVLLASLLSGGEQVLLLTNQDATGRDVVEVDSDEPPVKQSKRTSHELNQRDGVTLDSTVTLPGAHVTAEKDDWTKAYYHKKKKRIALVGVAPVALSLHRLDMGKGRFINDSDVRDGARIAVIGINVARDLFEDEDPLGKLIVAEGRQWQIVGVLANKASLGPSGDGPWMWNSKVLVPRSTFDSVMQNKHTVDEIYVKIGEGPKSLTERLAVARQAIGLTIKRQHYGVENFKIDPHHEEDQQGDVIISVIEMLVVGTGLISLFVGGINIMNIMLVTVTERTREIGVRRAIGASPGSIMLQFLIESSLIALTGGVIGVLSGLGLGWLATTLLSKYLVPWPMSVEMWSIVLGLTLSIVTGVAFGLFPAWRAAQLDPVEALRYE